MVSLLDLDSGNIRSLGNALNYLGIDFKIVKTSKEIENSKNFNYTWCRFI